MTDGKHPNELPQFRWMHTLLGKLKISLNGTFHSFEFDKYARRYLGGFCFRFNRRFAMAEITERIANAVYCCMPCTVPPRPCSDSCVPVGRRVINPALQMSSLEVQHGQFLQRRANSIATSDAVVVRAVPRVRIPRP